ncbi:MAG: aldo/keto reductase [Succinivibrio sp.]|nr:aldo/keto reductase [Succinivibrio sp.]
MKYQTLGKTDIKVSKICVGCMSYGKASDKFQPWTLNPEDSEKMIGYAFDQGVNFYDTANNYAFGTSEEYLGQALRNLKIPRDQVVIASKVYFNEGYLSPAAIAREIEGTLRRLGTDYLDLYQIHRFDHETPMEDTMQALDKLVRAGKVRALGASAMYGYQFHNLQIIAKEQGLTPFSTMQNHYNLLYREDERELIPVCKQYGVSLIPYSPLAAGHLCRKEWDSDSMRNATDKVMHRKYDKTKEADLKIIARVAELAERLQVSMTEVALGWMLNRGICAPIVGATKVKHFDTALKAVDLKLSAEDLAYLEELYVPHSISGATTENVKL